MSCLDEIQKLDCDDKKALTWPPGEHPALESFFEQVRQRIRDMQELLCECCGDVSELKEYEPLGYWPLDNPLDPNTDNPPSRIQHDIINDNDGFVIKNVGGGMGTKEPGISGLALDNDSGFSMVRVPTVLENMTELQLTNQAGTGGFTVLGWFYSTSVLNTTASMGQLDNVNEEGWSFGVNADGTSASVGWWTTDGVQANPGGISVEFDQIGQNEWCFVGFSISEWDDEVPNGQLVTFWINGQKCAEQEVVAGPIETAVTAADLGWGGFRGDDPNAVQIVGLMDECQIYQGVLTPAQVKRLWVEPAFVKNNWSFAQTLDDIPDGTDFERVGSEWVDDDDRPLPTLDRLAIAVSQNETCSEGGGLIVGTQPVFGGVDNEDESDYFGFLHWYEDGVHVHTQKTTNLWQGPLANFAPSTYSYSDSSTGSDAGDATQHTLSVEFVLMKVDGSSSGNNDAAIGYRKASIQATYGTC